MPFSEEVPAGFKPSCPCKRRGCPLQAYFVDNAHGGKRFFRYQCGDAKVWASCNKTIAPNETDPTKPAPTATNNTKPVLSDTATTTQPNPNIAPPAAATEAPKQAAKKPAPQEPSKQQLDHRCKEYPFDCWQCSPDTQEKCGVEPENRKAP